MSERTETRPAERDPAARAKAAEQAREKAEKARQDAVTARTEAEQVAVRQEAAAARAEAAAARAAAPPREEPDVLYANAEKDALVPAGSPEAAYVVNPADPGEFADLVPDAVTAKAQQPAEDKAARAPGVERK